MVGPPIGAENCRPFCGPGLGASPRASASSTFSKVSGVEILVGVLADQDHRGVDAGAKALDLLPGEIAVGGDMKRLVIDAPLANLLDLFAAAQQARRGAAPLHMSLAADRLEQEHGVEGRDLEHADLRHAEQLGDAFDRLLRQPAAGLLLGLPQHRHTAEAARPSGYFAIWRLAQSRFSAVKENSFG